jgi:colanic acid/amylovoran biosynthesis protein
MFCIMDYKVFKKQVKLIECNLKSSTWFLNLISSCSFFIPKRSIHTKQNFLLPSAGNGNIGDQAMLDSFLNYLSGECVLIVENINKFKSIHNSTTAMDYVEIPNLIYGNFFKNFVALMSILRLSTRMKSLSVIGADVMDGHYNLRASINRLFLLRVVNSRNIETRVTGFSWSTNAETIATKLLRKISEGTQLYVRDPESAKRLRLAAVNSITEVSDLVFHDQTVADFPIVEEWVLASVKPVVLVNISGLLPKDYQSTSAQIAQYTNIVKYLHSKGYRILVLPHVFRKIDGDLDVSDLLFSNACTSEDLIVRMPFTPSQERHFLRHVSFAITGRMHIAVMALSVGKPVIAIETMGKVKGLFDHFNLAGYCIGSNTNFSADVITQIKFLEAQYSKVCASINESLQEIRKKSSLNFSGFKQIEV